jgi:tetratricopeptide (TPR) repeat protein
MYRPILAIIVASFLLTSCQSNASKSKSSENNWQQIYKTAYTNHDYPTAIVALNQLLLQDSTNSDHYDSLATYYLKRTQNIYGGKIVVEKGLKLKPKNHLLLEYQGLVLIGEGKLAEARAIFEKAFEISKLNKFQYMIATTYANESNYVEFERIVDGLINNPNLPSEKFEAMIDNNNSQMVELKATCYLSKAKLSKDAATMRNYIDSTLKIQPDYQEAYYMLEELNKRTGAK